MDIRQIDLSAYIEAMENELNDDLSLTVHYQFIPGTPQEFVDEVVRRAEEVLKSYGS